MAVGYSSQILRVAYIDTSAVAAALGKTLKQGDIITDTDIAAVAGSLTWQELALNNDITQFKFTVDPLMEMQYGDKVRGDISRHGFHAPEGSITRPLDALFSTTHEKIVTSGLGKKVASSGNTDSVDADAQNTDSVTIVGTGIDSGDIGKFIKIGDNQTILLNVVGSVLTLANKINVRGGDTVTVQDHFNPDELEDYSFLMFVETAKGAHLVSWVSFGIDFATPPNELQKLTINWQGDVANKSTLTWATIGTVDAEAQSKAMVTSNFRGISLADSDNICANSFDFKMTREMTRQVCQGTESQQGNGGTFKEKYDAELTVKAYADDLSAIYDANDYLYVIGQKGDFAIYAPGALIRSEDTNTVNENQHTTDYVIGANVDMSKQMMILL